MVWLLILAFVTALRVISCRELIGDLVLAVEAGYLLAGKVRSVVREDGVGEPEATHYAPPQSCYWGFSTQWVSQNLDFHCTVIVIGQQSSSISCPVESLH